MDSQGLSIACAITAGLVQAFVAIVFLRFRSSRPDWGLGWLGCAFALASWLNLSAPMAAEARRVALLSSVMGLLSLFVGITVMCALVVGVRRYTGAHPLRAGQTMAVVWLVYLLSVASMKVPYLDPALTGNALTAVIFLYLSWRFMGAHRSEPDAGHWVASLMVGLYPPLVALGWFGGLDQHELRYWAAVPFALAGLGVMSATMGRLRGELVRLNATLESRVAQRTQALHDMLGSLESFSTMVSHDVKGTLGGISGLSRVALNALRQGDHDKASQLLDAIANESDQMVGVVSDLLSLARTSQTEVQKRSVDLATLVTEARHALNLQHGEELTARIQHGELPVISADPSLMRQALINLLSNALKFSRHVSEPRVEVSARPCDAGYVVSIEDNGAGFDPARAVELFQPFKRLDTSGRFDGSGVGLTIVRRIIERHGGRVWAEGRPGRGATFSFWLPRA